MSRYFPNDSHIDRLAARLLDRTLAKSQWTHAAHFASALWLLRRESDRPVERDMPCIIRAYNEATGVPNTDASGYHETITMASIRAARAFLARQPSSLPLHEIVDRLMDTALGDSRWLLAHWSEQRLFSVEARRRWVEPDLRPLAATSEATRKGADSDPRAPNPS
jgi:hypothetical protein